MESFSQQMEELTQNTKEIMTRLGSLSSAPYSPTNQRLISSIKDDLKNICQKLKSDSSLDSQSREGEKDWKMELAIAVCKEVGVSNEIRHSIRDQLDTCLSNSKSPRLFNTKSLPIPNFKTLLVQETVSKLLPDYLEGEVKTKLKSLVEVLKIYNEGNEEATSLIPDIVDDLMKDPISFEAYSCYFSSADELKIRNYLESNPTYRSYLETLKISSMSQHKKNISQASVRSFERLREPIKQKHSAILRFKNLLAQVANDIVIPQEAKSCLVFFAKLVARAKIQIEIYFITLNLSSQKLLVLDIKILEEMWNSLNDCFGRFLEEEELSIDMDKGFIEWKLLEMKLKLRPKLFKEGTHFMRDLLKAVFWSELVISGVLKDKNDKKTLEFIEEVVANNGKLEKTQQIASEENMRLINSKLEKLQKLFECKSELEHKYTSSLDQKHKSSYYLRVADIATESIGVTKPSVKAQIYSYLMRLAEKPNIKLRDEDIGLSRGRLIELDDILNSILHSEKAPTDNEIHFFYLRNKVRSKILEKLRIYLEEADDEKRIKIADTLLGPKDRNLDSFRSEFTNRDYEDFCQFLSTNKSYRRYRRYLEDKKQMKPEILQGKIDPFEKTEVLMRVNTDSEDSTIQNASILSLAQMKKKERWLESFEDSKRMPECSERCLIRLLAAIELTQLREHKIIDANLEKEFESLKPQLEMEGLISSIPQIADSVEKSKRYIKVQHWEDAKTCLNQVLKKIQILDFSLIIRLVKEAEVSAEITEDKKVLMFLGITGCGKSTTIHFLAGSKMYETSVKGLNHLEVVPNERYESLKKITTSPSAVSETRFITSVSIDPSDVPSSNTEGIVLCDTPGFEDTRSTELDIANAAGMVIAMKKCKGVKPVIVISSESLGDRLQGLRDIINILVRLTNKKSEEESLDFTAFNYIFTKFDEKETLTLRLQDLKQVSKEEGAPQVFLDCLADILEKLKREKGAFTLDPLKDQREQVLHKLVREEFIDDPKEVFQVVLAERSKKLLKEQLDQCKLNMMMAAQQQRYSYIEYRLEQLKNLTRQIKLEIIKETYDSCVKYLGKHLTEEFEKFTSNLGKGFYIQNTLLEQDIEAFKLSLDKFESLKPLLSEHKVEVGFCSYISYIKDQIERSVLELKSRKMEATNYSTFGIIFHKLDLTLKYFPEFKSHFDQACAWMLEQLKISVESLNKKIDNLEFDNTIVIVFSDLERVLAILGPYLENPGFQIEESKQLFLKKIKEQISSLEFIFQKERISEEDVERLGDFLKKIHHLKTIQGIQSCLDTKELSEISRAFVSRIHEFFNLRNSKANELLKANKEEAFEILEQEIREMHWIFKAHTMIEDAIHDTYNKTLADFVQVIRDINSRINSNLSESKGTNYDKLMEDINSLAKVRWIDKYHKLNTWADSIERIKTNIYSHLEKQKNFLLSMKLDIKNYAKVGPTFEKICSLENLKKIENLFPNVSEPVTEIGNCFQKKVKETLDEIQQIMNDWKDLDFVAAVEIEDIYNFLHCCSELDVIFPEEVKKLLTKLEAHVRAHGKSIQEKINSSYVQILCYRGSRDQKVFIAPNEIDILGKDVSRYLTTLQNIKEEHPKTFACFPEKIIEKFKKTFLEDWNELQDDFRAFIQINANRSALATLSVIKTLSIFDTYLEGNDPKKVCKKLRDALDEHLKQITKDLKDAIKNGEYSEACDLFKSLSISDDDFYKKYSEEAKKILSRFMADVFGETEEKLRFVSISRELKIEKLNQALTQLKIFQKIQDTFNKQIDGTEKYSPKKLWNDFLKKISEYLDRIENLKRTNNFPEFEKMLDDISFVIEGVGSNCSSQITDKLEKLDKRDFILLALLKKYAETEIENYGLEEISPKELLEKLTEANKINPVYNEYIFELKKAIFQKFREVLQGVTSDMSYNENCIRKYEKALCFVPESMKGILDAELKECRLKIKF